MAYIKNNWVDREGTTRYFETVDDDGALIFTPDYTQVTELGTPVNADNMNHIEDGIVDHENRITVLEEAGDGANTDLSNLSTVGQAKFDTKVNKSGDTMTGALELKPEEFAGVIRLYNSKLDYTNNEAPTNNDTFGIIQWRDKNGQWAGYCQVDERADGIRRIIQTVRRNINGTQVDASLGLQIDQQGNESLYTTKGIRREFTKFSFPSTKSTTFTVGTSGSTITAPANGYVSFMGNTSATSNAFVYLASNGVDSQGNGDGASNKNIHCSIPVSRGATVFYTYSNVKDMNLRFIYAQGDQG